MEGYWGITRQLIQLIFKSIVLKLIPDSFVSSSYFKSNPKWESCMAKLIINKVVSPDKSLKFLREANNRISQKQNQIDFYRDCFLPAGSQPMLLHRH